MIGLNLKKGQKIKINEMEFFVKEIIKRSFMKSEKDQVDYYSYELDFDDDSIRHASIDYIADDNIIFHLTKKVSSRIEGNSVEIDGKRYEIVKEKDEIYLDSDGEMKEAKCYEVSGERTGITPSELHVISESEEIFYLAEHIKKEDIQNE